MKKLSLILIIFSILLEFALAETLIPQYKGFPVYPPEQIEQFSNQTIDKITTVVKLSDFRNAEKYILENAPLCGWKLLYTGMFLDGGSGYFLFGKKSDKLNLVRVINHSFGGIVTDLLEEQRDCSVSYEFETLDVPVENQGFPLPLWIKSLSDCQVSKDIQQNTELVVPYDKETGISNDSFWKLYLEGALPNLYGWAKNNFIIPEEVNDRSPIVNEISFFVKDDQVVKLKRDSLFNDKGKNLEKRKIYLTFFTPAESLRLLSLYPENPSMELTVNSGAIIYGGRYIRPPYRLELKDYAIYVNGNLIFPKPPIPGYILISSLKGEADALRNNYILFRSPEGGMSGAEPATTVQDYLIKIDNIMKGKGSKELKRRQLQEIKGLSTPQDFHKVDSILTNWDGLK